VTKQTNNLFEAVARQTTKEAVKQLLYQRQHQLHGSNKNNLITQKV
jgi:hypothetical protein